MKRYNTPFLNPADLARRVEETAAARLAAEAQELADWLLENHDRAVGYISEIPGLIDAEIREERRSCVVLEFHWQDQWTVAAPIAEAGSARSLLKRGSTAAKVFDWCRKSGLNPVIDFAYPWRITVSW